MKYKILAVDDNPINLKLLNQAIVNANYQIITTPSAQEALQIASQQLPDLILLDVLMPEMDGYELCQKLQQEEETASIPVIFLSAKNETVDKAKGLSLGAIDYLTKPFDPIEINARINAHLKAHQSLIELKHKHRKLLTEFETFKNQHQADTEQQTFYETLDGWHKHNGNIRRKNYDWIVFSHKSKKPVTDLCYAFPVGNQQLIVVGLHGLENNYQTFLLFLMIQKYFHGFANSMRRKPRLDGKNLDIFVNQFMDAFSPDEYNIVFTFSLNYIHLKDMLIHSYRLKLQPPHEIDVDGNVSELRGTPKIFNSKYAKIVTSETFALHKNRFLLFHTHNQSAPPDLIKSIIPHLKANNFELNQAAKTLTAESPFSVNDRNISLLHIK
ncbi:MAG: response regulator [Caldithrix sp.]|nr:response regulator [Caldithrix sp.]